MSSLILASASASRRAQLSSLHIPFQAIPADIDETPQLNEAPIDLALRLSREKAEKIARAYPDATVIGSDQVAVCEGIWVEKPITHEKAVAQWKLLNGKTVYFYTGICVIHQAAQYEAFAKTQIQFKPLSDAQIEAYLQKDQPYHCCAGIKVESLGITLIESIQSDDPTAIVGLPLILTCKLLEQAGFKLF